MVMIRDIPSAIPVSIKGNYRLHKIIPKEKDVDQFDAILADSSGTILCKEWNPAYSSPQYIHQLFECTLQVGQEKGGQKYATHTTSNQIESMGWSRLQEIATRHFPRPELVDQLLELLEDCDNLSIVHFLYMVFDQSELAIPFFLLPASHDHHHSNPGGLAEHSIETARIALSAMHQASAEESALIMVAALLHDIGKIRTLTLSGKKTTLGRVIRHEQLTLELLAAPLTSLGRKWPDGATALRYLLTFSPEQSKRPLLPYAMTINYADRMSASLSSRKKSIQQDPYKSFISTQSRGQKSWFWIPEKERKMPWQQ